jgi:general secretion pathway protein L
MAQVLSIDIREDVVCGVMLSVTSRAVAVVGCAVAVIDERPFIEAVAEVLLHVGFKGEPCRVSFGAEHFFYRNLTFPFADKRKINRILPFELEESSPVDMDSLLVDSLVMGRKGKESSVMAAMVSRDYLRQQLSELKSLGIDPEIVGISNVQTALQFALLQSQSEFILLETGCRRLTMFVMAEGRINLIRSITFDDGSLANFSYDRNSQLVSARRPEKTEETLAVMCRGIKHTLIALADVGSETPIYITGPLSGLKETILYLGKNLGCEILLCDLIQKPVKVGLECGLWRSDVMTSALALGLRSGKRQSGFNFRRDEFVKKHSLKKYKKLVPRLGAPLLVCLAVAIGYLWNDYILREKDLTMLKMQGREVFTATLPEVKRIVDPVTQLRAEMKELKKGTLGEDSAQPDVKILDLLAEISVRIPKSQNVHVVRMVADRNGILLRGLTDNFNTVDNLKKVLEKSPYFSSVTINSANLAPKDAGIRFELKLQLNRA